MWVWVNDWLRIMNVCMYVCVYQWLCCMFCAQIELNRFIFRNLCHWDLFALYCLVFWSNLKARFYVLNTQLVVFKNHVVLHYDFSLSRSLSLSFFFVCAGSFTQSVLFLSRSFALFNLNGLLALYCLFVSAQCDFILEKRGPKMKLLHEKKFATLNLICIFLIWT